MFKCRCGRISNDYFNTLKRAYNYVHNGCNPEKMMTGNQKLLSVLAREELRMLHVFPMCFCLNLKKLLDTKGVNDLTIWIYFNNGILRERMVQ